MSDLNSGRISLNIGIILALMAAGASCAGSKPSDKDVTEQGPTVLSVRTEPGTIELNRDLQPIEPAAVLADVKDLRHPVQSVTLQFENIPLAVPMENIGGTTWRAELTPRQLEMMAVSGRTTRYDARVVAKNAEGETGSSQRPVEVAVRAPNIYGNSSG